MKMEVVIPVATMDFDFSGARSSPFLSAPTTPKRFGQFCFSAPTSPARVSEFYREFDNFSVNNGGNGSMRTRGSPSVIPFDWEEKPGTPKSPKSNVTNNEDDFAFDFCVDLEKTLLSADELFDGGKIRPLKPPPRLQVNNGVDGYTTRKSPISPRSPRSPISHGKKILQNAFSPRQRKDVDPFAAAAENTRKNTGNERGRERVATSSSSNSGRRATRSLSPFRVSEFPWEEEEQPQQSTKQPSVNTKSSLSSSSSSSSSSAAAAKGNRKWKLKDFLLFRSASEGRATDKDPFKKYAAFSKRHEDIKNSSFRSIDSNGSVSRRRGPVSAHELHYTVNRAVSEDMKKKTFLPYKQGILGRLAFNPAVSALANGFGTLTRG